MSRPSDNNKKKEKEKRIKGKLGSVGSQSENKILGRCQRTNKKKKGGR